MELPNKIEYAMLAMLALADRYADGEPLQIRQIAAEQNIPNRYLDQLLAELRRGGLIRSERGAKGGYRLAQTPDKITVLAVVNCIQGVDWQDGDADDDTDAESSEISIIIEAWEAAMQAANTVLQKYTLKDLLDRRESHRHSIMYYI
jgi:Rrf2 family protein